MIKHSLRVMHGRQFRHLVVISYDDQYKKNIGGYYMPEFSYSTRVIVVKDYQQLMRNIEVAKERGTKSVRNAINNKYPLRFC